MWFFIGIISLYSLLLIYFTYLWKHGKTTHAKKPLLKVTVIVPFRNEENNLPLLINSFSLLDYTHKDVEFIFINDHSSDQSLQILEQLLIHFPFSYQVLTLSREVTGKKQAIMLGVSKADGSIILSTDADCEVPSNWLQLMQAPFHSQAVHLVSGNVVFKGKSFLDKLFQMEFAPLIGVGGVSIQLGKPGMANGANLAFRKSTFIELDVFRDNMHIPTGDDVFLLQKIGKHYPKGVVFQKECIVSTNPPHNLNVFFNQRIRWASKWKASANRKDKVPALLIWIFHLIYLIGMGGFIHEGKYLLAIGLFFLKMMAEYSFLAFILKSQGQKFNISVFVILQLVYSFYVIIFGLMANFSAYQWKGRIYGKHER